MAESSSAQSTGQSTGQPAGSSERQADPQAAVRAELRLRLADEALSAAADRVGALLREAALELRPFPPFPGAFFTIGVEVEPDGVQDRAIGCVIVTEEGELRELQISFDDEGPAALFGASDPVSMRDETLLELDYVSAHDRLTLARNGLEAISALLSGKSGTARVGGGATEE